jgi:hypothetical protein
MLPLRGQNSAQSSPLFVGGKSGGGASDSDIRELKAQVEKLELIVEALWRQLKRHTELSDEDLIETITEIDLEDGQYDGKKAKQSFRECPGCHRRINKHHGKCFYCGEVLLVQPFA